MIKTPTPIFTPETNFEQPEKPDYKYYCKCCNTGYLKEDSALLCQIINEKDAEEIVHIYKIKYPECSDEYLENLKSDYKNAIKNHESTHVRLIRSIEK